MPLCKGSYFHLREGAGSAPTTCTYDVDRLQVLECFRAISKGLQSGLSPRAQSSCLGFRASFYHLHRVRGFGFRVSSHCVHKSCVCHCVRAQCREDRGLEVEGELSPRAQSSRVPLALSLKPPFAPDSGFGVWGLGLGAWGLGFGVRGLGFGA